MRALLLIAILAACGPEPTPYDPKAPVRYRVLKGDTWDTIASKRTCTPEELRAWNGLAEDHVLVPGEVLWIYRDGRGIGDPDAPKPTPVASTGGTAARAPAASPAPDAPKRVVDVERPPRTTALLSLLEDLNGGPELKAVPSVQGGKMPSGTSLGNRDALGGGGEVDNATVQIERLSEPPAPGLAAPEGVPQLPAAQAKRCLPMKAVIDPGDYGMVAAEGLSKDAIRGGMRPALSVVTQCLPSDASGPFDVHLEVRVGCDGLVYETEVVKTAGLPAAITDCVAAVADQLSFPAAAGATSFLYPIRLRR